MYLLYTTEVQPFWFIIFHVYETTVDKMVVFFFHCVYPEVVCTFASPQAGELTHMKEYQRYMRLQHLLQKSSIYSKFLLERMENQIEEKKVCSLFNKHMQQHNILTYMYHVVTYKGGKATHANNTRTVL